jgi:hypothetical protein
MISSWTGSADDWGGARDGIEGEARAGYLRDLADDLLAGPRSDDPLDAGQALDPKVALLSLMHADGTRCKPPLGAVAVRKLAEEVAREMFARESEILEVA